MVGEGGYQMANLPWHPMEGCPKTDMRYVFVIGSNAVFHASNLTKCLVGPGSRIEFLSLQNTDFVPDNKFRLWEMLKTNFNKSVHPWMEKSWKRNVNFYNVYQGNVTILFAIISCTMTGVELWRKGILQKHGVQVLGTPVSSIEATEDREIFADGLKQIGEKLAPSIAVSSVCTNIEILM